MIIEANNKNFTGTRFGLQFVNGKCEIEPNKISQATYDKLKSLKSKGEEYKITGLRKPKKESE